jgi:hypothetical protein
VLTFLLIFRGSVGVSCKNWWLLLHNFSAYLSCNKKKIFAEAILKIFPFAALIILVFLRNFCDNFAEAE